MTTKTFETVQAGTTSLTGILPVVFALILGLGIVAITGHVQASALHDAAHDVRHANGFPCH
jgi:cobalt transporter subunit CbtB